MKSTLGLVTSFGLMVLIGSIAVAAQTKKKTRKKVPAPRSRAEVVVMSGGSTHDVEWQRNSDGSLVATGDKPPDESYKSPNIPDNPGSTSNRNVRSRRVATKSTSISLNIGRVPQFAVSALSENLNGTSLIGMNNKGDVIGWRLDMANDSESAFTFSHNTLLPIDVSRLITNTGGRVMPKDINNRGDVIGDFEPSGLSKSLFFYRNGLTENVETGYTNIWSSGINDRGEIVGRAYTTLQEAHAFLYSGNTFKDLGTLGGQSSCAEGINTNGEVVGWSETMTADSRIYHAFRYSGGVLEDIGTLGGKNSFAFDINDNGQIVGVSTTTQGTDHVFVYKAGRMLDLNIRAPHIEESPEFSIGISLKLQINNGGQVLGSLSDDNGSTFAFLWQEGNLIDITKLVPASMGGDARCTDCAQ